MIGDLEKNREAGGMNYSDNVLKKGRTEGVQRQVAAGSRYLAHIEQCSARLLGEGVEYVLS